MHLPPPIARVTLRPSATPQRVPWPGGRCKLQHRRLLPPLRNSNQHIDTIHITPTECVDSRGNPCQPRADIWSRDRGDPALFAQLALTHFGLTQRPGFLPACPQLREGGSGFLVLRKVLLGQHHREILLLGYFHARGFPGAAVSQIVSPKHSAPSATDRVHRNPEYRQYVRRSPLLFLPISGKYRIGADQTMKPRNEGPLWTAIPRSSLSSCA